MFCTESNRSKIYEIVMNNINYIFPVPDLFNKFHVKQSIQNLKK